MPVTLFDAIEIAARDLPDGWELEICVERGAAFVRLFDDIGEEVVLASTDTLVGDVLTAVRTAIEKGMQDG